MEINIQSLQFRRMNKQRQMTLRQVWDVISRNDAPKRLLIETWGGKPDGYIKCFPSDLLLGSYLSKRIAKSALDAIDDDLGLSFVGDETYLVEGIPDNLNRAVQSENHENAKLRMKISGAREKWDEESCLNKVLFGIVNFDDEVTTTNDLTQAMASRIKSTFKRGGTYNEQLHSMYEFIQATGDELDDVLAAGECSTEYAPMDKERITEVIQLADGLREKMAVSRPEMAVEEPQAVHITEPEVNRGEAWGGWA